ncbi:MAG: hypothetical protein OEP48_15530 [Betaproteobacteria bacterium]|nr:hypothetical protein [Betaproteobacteria bacterium]MDH3438783.1 hypothetical protein [Betaproteobacteria bacterium]
MKTRMFSQWFALFAAAAFALGVATATHAASPTGVTVADAVVITAEVVGLDKADRIVTLLGPNGNVVDIEAGDEVRNFDQIEVADKVKVTYYESVAIYLGVPGTQPEADAAAVMVRAPKGAKPGGAVAGAIDVSATVKGIDKKKRELTLRLPDGKVVKNEVDPSVKAFDTLKVGDTIHARLTRALAISVESR